MTEHFNESIRISSQSMEMFLLCLNVIYDQSDSFVTCSIRSVLPWNSVPPLDDSPIVYSFQCIPPSTFVAKNMNSIHQGSFKTRIIFLRQIILIRSLRIRTENFIHKLAMRVWSRCIVTFGTNTISCWSKMREKYLLCADWHVELWCFWGFFLNLVYKCTHLIQDNFQTDTTKHSAIINRNRESKTSMKLNSPEESSPVHVDLSAVLLHS